MYVNFQLPVINYRKEQEAFQDLVSRYLFQESVVSTFTSGYFNPIPETYSMIKRKALSKPPSNPRPFPQGQDRDHLRGAHLQQLLQKGVLQAPRAHHVPDQPAQVAGPFQELRQ